MAFTREEMAAYEAQPAKVVPDNTSPFDASAAATQPTAETDETSAPADDSDPADLGDGTSDENSDSSTDHVEPDDDAGSDEEGDADESAGDEEPADGDAAQPPKKGSARARIQELAKAARDAADLADGYKEFGKLTSERLKATEAELARLRAGGKPTAPTAPASETTKTEEAKIGKMPKLSDPDVNFDPDVLAAKQEAWFEKLADERAAQALRKATGADAVAKVEETFVSRVEKFKQANPDFDKKAKNPDLLPLHLVTQAKIKTMDLAPEILNELVNDPDNANRIARLDAADQLLEIGEIRVAIKAKQAAAAAKAKEDADAAAAAANGGKPPQPKPKTPAPQAKPGQPPKSVSKAPPPPTPTPAGKRSQPREETDPNLDMDEFARRHREGKQQARINARKMRGLN